MIKEEEILDSLVREFPFLQGKAKVQRVRRLIADVEADKFEQVFAYAKEYLAFSVLCTITGLDEGATLGFIYHMARSDGITLSLKYSVPKDNPVINSILKYFTNADIYERELEDLLGAKVAGLPEGNRYPLPDDWPKGEHPLRKDWKPKDAQINSTEAQVKETI